MKISMRTYEFTILATGMNPENDDFEDRLFQSGLDDATASTHKGLIVLDVAREAPTFADAVASACLDVCRAGARIVRIEPDHLVTQADVAERAGLSRAAVSLYRRGDRGDRFPHPIAKVTSDSPLWDWAEVSRWLCTRKQVTNETVLQALVIREANRAIQNSSSEDFAREIRDRLNIPDHVSEPA